MNLKLLWILCQAVLTGVSDHNHEIFKTILSYPLIDQQIVLHCLPILLQLGLRAVLVGHSSSLPLCSCQVQDQRQL